MLSKRQLLSKVLILAILATFIPVLSAFAQEVKIGAGAAPTENIFSRIKEPLQTGTGLKLVLISNGPVEAFKDLDKGQIDAASGGLTLPDWMDLMEKEGYTLADKSIYKSRVIGKDVVKVIANKDSGVKNLTGDQLKGIFTGKISNWKEVGGADLPVKVILGNKIPAHSLFSRNR